MVSETKRQELNERRGIECRLFDLGLSIREVASALGIGTGSVVNDSRRIRQMGGSHPNIDPNWSKRRNETYPEALREYTDIRNSVHGGLKDALENYLDIRHIREIAEGVAAMVHLHTNPADPEKYRGYRKLLNAIFGFWWEEISGEVILEYYLEAVSEGSVLPPIRDSVADSLAMWAENTYCNQYRLSLNDAAVRGIDSALRTLSPKEEKIVRMRFGISREREHTLEEIKQEFDVTYERIRQIEAKALRKLRHPSRSGKLKLLLKSPFDVMMHWLEHKFPVSPPPVSPKPEFDRDLLDVSIEDLNVSVRTYNCLVKANICTVGELAQRTEAEILRIKNLGMKSLREIKKLLSGRGLFLGMTFTARGDPIFPVNHETAEETIGPEGDESWRDLS